MNNNEKLQERTVENFIEDVIVFLLCSMIVFFLWNLILPDLFNFPHINYWQTLGIMLICRFLF